MGSANRNPSARLSWRFPAYAVNIASGTVTQIRTATGTAMLIAIALPLWGRPRG